ncbi:hypothetical protein DSCW_03880 [Desulfosarcina widdelii]|uniref:Methyltransferase domain-containing protein n=1 Tax=Desulfosarcina widdelii TaxID=947919 RepID=A0A5K7Z0K2_9BACT|nr:class I SAM-dependent methyltransferase [Desulfosarcina widdelii]BBO72971.1 hypothetical protein DSCW_03880 [Desulfosarcina widdelii]
MSNYRGKKKLNKYLSGINGLRILKKIVLNPKIPNDIKCNFKTLNAAELKILEATLKNNFFKKEAKGYLYTDVGKKDILDHLEGRLEEDRKFSITWLNSVRKLKGRKVLEIGCGTGASTVALAEQGAVVTAVDIDHDALTVAKKRCEIYRLKVDFLNLNVKEIKNKLFKNKYDFVIFWACLEHMTNSERMIAMKETWEMLPIGGLWCVTDTPNRLYFYDSHTSQLPFFHWLPDDLAIKYANFSPREKFKNAFRDFKPNRDDMINFFRWGRGVSFHEFEMTMKPLSKLNIISCRSIFHRRQGILFFLKSITSSSFRYESFLKKRFPKIHSGFFQPYLNLIIKKD